MKRIYIFLLGLGILFSASSCDKWLEANSSTKIPADDMFSTRDGFYDALSGIYIAMGDSDCYGGSYTWFVNELTACPYVYQVDPLFDEIQKHNYKSLKAQGMVEKMWQDGYFIIANINLMLRELDKRRDVVTSDVEYNLFKGELLGLRAYLHFDIMRMFGVNDWNGANAAKMAVPYVCEYSKDVTPQLSYKETAAKLLDDVKQAMECLSSSDPVTGSVSKDFETTVNQKGFWNNRTKHLNYYAVEALAARVRQWMGDTAEAASLANDVIDGVLANNLVSWIDVEGEMIKPSFDDKDWTFSSEHIFSLEVTSLADKGVNKYIFGMTLPVMALNESTIEALYPVSDPDKGSAGVEDVRGPAHLLKWGAYGYTPYKFYNSPSYDVNFKDRVPMIKLPEMYYIVAEDHLLNGRNDKAAEALDQVRKNRGILLPLPEEIDLEKEITEEYYREFIGEGQIFYLIKRKNLENPVDESFTVKAADLVYPYPEDEISYGRKQEL